jgi:transposase
MDDVREELKRTLSELGPRGAGKRYPKGLLEKLLSYTVARRRQGATLVAIGDEVGMSWKTLARWLGGRKTRARFERVEVIEPVAAGARPLVVHGPRGLRIEGLDVGGVAELLRKLGE